MKKIAVCIPSYNESHIIEDTVKKVDKGLNSYMKNGYDAIIVNIDNNSPDKTQEIFKKTITKCKKIALTSNELGKGVNILNFFDYCYNNSIDYAMTIDADVSSMQPSWIIKFLSPLINDNYDYITPIYKRSRFEGSTTNHFAFPLIYAITGKPIRQPIAGDFAFNLNFVSIIRNQKINDSIKKYGIDIFMTLTACFNNLKVYQIELDKKIHNPSYNKMENMFREVLNSFVFTWINLKNNNLTMDYAIGRNDKTLNSIISSRNFKHKQRAIELYSEHIKKIDKNLILENLWVDCLVDLIKNPELVDTDKVFNTFMARATKFWLQAEKASAKECEKIINNQAKKTYTLLRKKGI